MIHLGNGSEISGRCRCLRWVTLGWGNFWLQTMQKAKQTPNLYLFTVPVQSQRGLCFLSKGYLRWRGVVGVEETRNVKSSWWLAEITRWTDCIRFVMVANSHPLRDLVGTELERINRGIPSCLAKSSSIQFRLARKSINVWRGTELCVPQITTSNNNNKKNADGWDQFVFHLLIQSLIVTPCKVFWGHSVSKAVMQNTQILHSPQTEDGQKCS